MRCWAIWQIAQRIGISRESYKQANVLIFDKVTSTQDYEIELAAIASIKEQSKEVTILHIAYRITTLIIVIKLKF